MNRFKELIRLSDWKSEKMPFVFLCIFYMQSVFHVYGYDFQFYFKFFLVVIFGLCYFAFLFLTNDLVDLEQDLKAGKVKVFKAKDKPILWFFSMTLFIVGALSFYTLAGGVSKFSSLVLVLGFVIAYLYSGYPLRFKESGVWGLVFGSLVLRPLPILMITALIPNMLIDPGFILILSWIEILSINKIIQHQLDDYENDNRSKTNTFTTDVGFEKAYKLRRFLIPLETLSLGLAVLVLVLNNIYMLVAFLIYGFYHLVVFVKNPVASDKYFKSKRINLFDLTVVIMPISMAIILAVRDGLWVVPIFIIYWQHRWIKDSFLIE